MLDTHSSIRALCQSIWYSDNIAEADRYGDMPYGHIAIPVSKVNIQTDTINI